MADIAPLARSPIAPAEPAGVVGGWLVSGRRSRAGLRLADHTPLTKIAVRAARAGAVAAHLGVPPGGAARDGGRLIATFAPGEWLVIGPIDQRAALTAQLDEVAQAADELATVLDVTHGRVLLRLSGAAAAAVLSKVCAIDLHDDATPDGTALRSAVAAVVTDIVREDAGAQRSYLLGCEWSSGQYLHEAVLEAGREFGIDVDGFHHDVN
ncbi:MAG TPA: sarcosine oxidase subunit gamma family protein [Euzebyales bacterium]|nr:sarcosine oxidase subunit gamma family protein [Euzebyales bacterium]